MTTHPWYLHPCTWAGIQHSPQKNTPCSLSPLERGLQSSRSTFSWGSFPSFFAFKEGMWVTRISALGGWPTVSARFFATQGRVGRVNIPIWSVAGLAVCIYPHWIGSYVSCQGTHLREQTVQVARHIRYIVLRSSTEVASHRSQRIGVTWWHGLCNTGIVFTCFFHA